MTEVTIGGNGFTSMMAEATTEWRPIWVQRIDTQITECQTDRNKHHRMVEECDARLKDLREKRKPWTEIEGRDAEKGVG